MNAKPSSDELDDLLRRVDRDLIDGYDEELELEVEDRELDGFDRPLGSGDTAADRVARQRYFRELFRLQGGLVKLQDWVAHTGHKVVILFLQGLKDRTSQSHG